MKPSLWKHLYSLNHHINKRGTVVGYPVYSCPYSCPLYRTLEFKHPKSVHSTSLSQWISHVRHMLSVGRITYFESESNWQFGIRGKIMPTTNIYWVVNKCQCLFRGLYMYCITYSSPPPTCTIPILQRRKMGCREVKSSVIKWQITKRNHRAVSFQSLFNFFLNIFFLPKSLGFHFLSALPGTQTSVCHITLLPKFRKTRVHSLWPLQLVYYSFEDLRIWHSTPNPDA